MAAAPVLSETPYLPDVYRAICQVQKAISRDGISKGQRNQQQGYAFRGIDQVQNALSALLAGADLCILPRMLSRTQEERTTAKGGLLFYVTVQADFDFVSSRDGSRHTVTMYGEAMDSGDKATNKAMSAAYKYACLQVFCIPTEGMDADAVTHTPTPKHTPAQMAIVNAKLKRTAEAEKHWNQEQARRASLDGTMPQPAAAIAATIPEPQDEDSTPYTYEEPESELEVQLAESIGIAEDHKARRSMMAAFGEIEQRYRKIGFAPTFGAILGRYCVHSADQFTDMDEARSCYREMSVDVAKREAAHAKRWGGR